MCFRPFIFSSMVTNRFFFLSFSSLSSPFHILSNSSTSSFSLQNPLFSLSISPYHNLTSPLSFFLKLSPSLNFLISSMAPKSKKNSYVLSKDALNLTRWSGAMRLMESPLLTYHPEDHLSANAQVRLVSFSFFFLISSFPLIFYFDLFLDL